MICPYCSKEMESGMFQAGNMIIWTNAKHPISLNPKGNDILFEKNYFTISGVTVDGHICRDCGKIIVDVEQ